MTVRGTAAGGVAGGEQRARALVPGRPGLGPQLHPLRLRAPQRVSASPASMSTPLKWVQFLPQGLFR